MPLPIWLTLVSFNVGVPTAVQRLAHHLHLHVDHAQSNGCMQGMTSKVNWSTILFDISQTSHMRCPLLPPAQAWHSSVRLLSILCGYWYALFPLVSWPASYFMKEGAIITSFLRRTFTISAVWEDLMSCSPMWSNLDRSPFHDMIVISPFTKLVGIISLIVRCKLPDTAWKTTFWC